jgi:2-hydroxychromene-2-carboxylate isomerase
MPHIDFIFDFGSPNAYLVHKVIPKFEAETNVRFNYIPCLLGGIFKATGNQAPMKTNAAVRKKLDYDRLEFMRFLQVHNLNEFTFNPHFPVNTLLLMRGAVAAQRCGELLAYIDAGLHHMWEEPKDMADPEVAAAALTSSRLDGTAIMQATQDPEIKAELVANTTDAVERGAFGVPTFFVGDEMFFGKERLGQVCEEVERQNK